MDSKRAFELSPIKAMELAAAKVPNVISLAQGIPSFPTPQVIKDFVKEKIDQGLCDKYSLTIGLSELREEIAHSLKDEGLVFDPDQEILATAGSIEGITAALLSLTEPGDQVILPSPSYVSYQGAIGIARAQAVFAPLDEDNNFDFDIEAVKAAITPRTRVILYCSPNNPTGTIFSEHKTRQILELAEEHNLTILVDEVYKDFYYSDEKHFTAMSIKEARQRIIRVCSFSKAYAMTGWRIGFVHCDRNLMQPILKFHDAMVTCAPVVSQYAAIAALKYGQPHLNEFKRLFRERRDYTIKVLDSLSHILDYQLPKAAYFVFPRIKDTVPLARDSKKLAYDILEKAAVALVPGSAFGPSGESHLRITFGREKADLEEGLARLSAYFSESKRKHSSVKRSMVSKRPAGFWKQTATKLLSVCAALYLKRNKSVVVGIAGLKGKTVYKRRLLEVLQKHEGARANLLSFNTKVGFPAAVLNVESHVQKKEYFRAAMKVFSDLVFGCKRTPLLILEYGISDQDDARRLLEIKIPDWLILSEIATADSSMDYKSCLEGIALMIEKTESSRILWADDELIKGLSKPLLASHCLLDSNLQSEDKSRYDSLIAHGDLVGQSAQRAEIAALLLHSKLIATRNS